MIEAWELGFCLGNAVKYICRAGKKGSVIEDLAKARWYLDREIARLTPKTVRIGTNVTLAQLQDIVPQKEMCTDARGGLADVRQ